MTEEQKTGTADPILKATWRLSGWKIFGAGILGLVALVAAYCQQLERPFLDRFDPYEPKHWIIDARTKKVVELGRIYNFSSEAIEVGVFDSVEPNRQVVDLHVPMIGVAGANPYPERVEYDGQCYFVRTGFRKDWSSVRPIWTDESSGKTLCFYLLTPDGKRIDKN